MASKRRTRSTAASPPTKITKENNATSIKKTVRNPYKKDKSQPGELKFAAYLLNNGKVETIARLAEIEEFEEENSYIIVEKERFSSKIDMDAWVTSREKRATSPGSSVKNGQTTRKMTPEERKRLNKALIEIEHKRPSNRVELFYKTSSKSNAVVVVPRFLDEEGKDMWCIKGEHVGVALNAYVGEFRQQFDIVDYALKHLKSGRMRDPSGDGNKVFTKKWTSPTTNKSRDFEVYLSWTHFLLPDTIRTQEQEDQFIESTCREIGTTMIEIMKTEFFAKCLEGATNKENMWRAISRPGIGYLSFLQGAKVIVTKAENLNKHLVREDATTLVGLLYDHNRSAKKYLSQEEEEENDEQHNPQQADNDLDDDDDDAALSDDDVDKEAANENSEGVELGSTGSNNAFQDAHSNDAGSEE